MKQALCTFKKIVANLTVLKSWQEIIQGEIESNQFKIKIHRLLETILKTGCNR